MGGSPMTGPPNGPPGRGVPGGSMMTGPLGIGPAGGIVNVGAGGTDGMAGPGTGKVVGPEPGDEPPLPGVSVKVPLGIGFGIGNAAGDVTSGAWPRAVATGAPSDADGSESRAAGTPSWAMIPGTETKVQPRPIRIRFIDPPSGQ